MRIRKRILALLCAFALLLSLGQGAFAAGTDTTYTLTLAGTSENQVKNDKTLDCAVTVNQDGTTATLTFVRYVPSCDTLVIPETINVKTGDGTISVTITALGSRIFRLGQYSFKAMSIPMSVTAIDSGFLAGFKNDSACFDAIEVADENTSYESVDGVLLNEDGTTLLKFPLNKSTGTYTFPDTVTAIGNYAFGNVLDASPITLPEGVASIGTGAFGSAATSELELPSTLRSIGNSGMSSMSNITALNLPEGLTTIGDSAFSSCRKITGIDLPSTVTSVGKGVFSDCGAIREAVIAMETIPKEFLKSCGGLMSLTLKEGVQVIGEGAFSGCNRLPEVTLPSTVTTIGKGAFSSASQLTEVTFNSGLTTIGEEAFNSSGLTGPLSLPDSVTTLGQQAFGNTKITSITSLGGVTDVPAYAFLSCNSLTEVTLPGTVTTLGNKVFGSCEGLRKVVLPDRITEVPDNTFSGCTALTDVTLPDSVTSIGSGAFSLNSALKTITLPAGLTTLGSQAFNGCRGLTEITIPDGVSVIENSTFENCESLQTVSFPSSLTTIKSDAFGRCKALQSVALPAALTTLSTSGFTYTIALREVTFGGPAPDTGGYNPFTCSDRPVNVTVYYPEGTAAGFETWKSRGNLTLKPITDKPSEELDVEGTTITLSAVLQRSTDQKNLLLWCTVDVSPKYHTSDDTLVPSGPITFTLSGTGLPAPIHFVGGGDTLHQTVGYEMDTYIGQTITVQAHLAASIGFGSSDSNALTGLVIPKPNNDKEYPFVPGGSSDDAVYETTPDAAGTGVVITKIKGEMAARPTPVIPATIDGKPVTGLGAELFAGNNNTGYVTIPSSVKTLGTGIFKNCINLVTVSLPADLTEIPADTFSGCTNKLSTVVLPKTVTKLGSNAFQNCKAMKYMTFPASLATLDKTAFSGCNLDTVTFEGNAPAFDGVGRTNFGAQTIYYLKSGAAGFDAAPWVGIRRPPVALGISYGTPTFPADFATNPVMELPITFNTSAYQGVETAQAIPDLAKVVVKVSGFQAYGVTAKNATANGGTLVVPIETQFYGWSPSVRVEYPGDWYFNTAFYYSTGYVQMPTPKRATAVAAVAAEAKAAENGILELWVTPTITPADYFGQGYRPKLSRVKLTLNGEELTSGLQVVEDKIRATIPAALVGQTVPLTVTFQGDDRFEASTAYDAGNITVPGTAPVTLLTATAGDVLQRGSNYILPLTVGLSVLYAPAGSPEPNRGLLSITVNGTAVTPAVDGDVFNITIDRTLLDTTAAVVVRYAGESDTGYIYKEATVIKTVPLADPNPTPVNTALSATAGELTQNSATMGYYLPVEVTLTHDRYGNTNYAPDRADIRITLDGDEVIYTVGSGNYLRVPITPRDFASKVTIVVTYPNSKYFKSSSQTLTVDIPDPALTSAETTVSALAGKLTKAQDGASYYLPVDVTLTHKAYGNTGYAPDRADLKVTLNGSAVECTTEGSFFRIPIGNELFFSRAAITVTYPGSTYFKSSSVTLTNVEIPQPNAPKADTSLAAVSSGKLLFGMAGSPPLVGRYILPVTVTLSHDVYRGDSSLAPSLDGITVTMDGAAVTEFIWTSNVINIPLVEAQYGKTVSIGLRYPGEEHFNPSSFTIASVAIDDPRPVTPPPSGNTGGGSSTPPAPKPEAPSKVTVSDKDVTEAVKAAAESGSVVLKAETKEDAESVAVTVPASVMKAIAKAEAPVSIQSPVADLKLDVKVLETLQRSGAKDVVVSAGAADSAALPKAAQEVLAGRPVYDISITAGGKSVSQFGGGSVTVALPYTPTEGEDPAALVACWVKEDGTTEILRNSAYKDGKLTFSTPHLSTYAIVHKDIAFVDVSGDNWAKADIGFAASRGILNGMGDNLFGPGFAITGSMAVAALARIDGVLDGAPGTDWDAPALAWAEEKGILPEGFNPDTVMTREQFAYLAAGFMGGAEKVNGPGYVDVTQISLPCLDSVNYLTSMGIMQGTGDGHFSPQAFLTRSELAAILHRLVDRQIG